MAGVNSDIIFQQKPYAGPTVEELQNKQNMNALRNTLGEGYSIDDPQVVNAMMARDPDMGLKLMTNANSMRKSAADTATSEQERMAAELDRYVPVAMAVAQNKDQAAWTELHGELTRMFPSLGRSLPTNVEQAGPAVQSYVDARNKLKGSGSQASTKAVQTANGVYLVDPMGNYTPMIDANGKQVMSLGIGTAQIGAGAGIEKAKIAANASMYGANTRAQNAADLQTNKALNAAALAGAPSAAIPMGATPPPVAPNAPQNKPEAAARVKLDTAYPQASAGMDQTEHAIDTQIALLDKLSADKGLDAITGPIASRTPDVTPEATRARAAMKTLLAQGGFDALRGLKVEGTTLGQVTEGEHRLLRESLGALDLAQDARDVRAALQKYRDQLLFSKQNLRKVYDQTYAYKTGAAVAPTGGATSVPGAPKIGDVVDGYTFKGGDPSKQENWSK